MKRIPFHVPCIGVEEERAVREVLRSGWLTTGARAKSFEQSLSQWCDGKPVISLNSCTAGMHLLLCAYGIGAGDEVIVPSLTFASTANVVIHCAAEVRFADVDEKTGTLSPASVIKAITKKTKAIIAVHLDGYPADMLNLKKIAKQYKLRLFEDAAHALGARYRGKACGALADGGAFSFYATKNITTAEGGAVCVPSRRIADKIRTLSLHGLSRDAWGRYKPGASVFYRVVATGYKYNMSDVQAAIGEAQLKKYNTFYRARKKVWGWYEKELANMDGLMLPPAVLLGEHGLHLFVLRTKTARMRTQLLARLKKKGVYAQVHFIALHVQPFYAKRYNHKPSDFPISNSLSQKRLSLPFYPQLSRKDVQYVCDQIKACMTCN